jgi:hypothetical protein
MSLRQVLESHASAQILKRKTHDAARSLQIFSSPRGGSTWLMSLLSKLPGVAGVWEPLHDTKGVVPDRWGARPHRRAMTDGDKALLAEILAGNRLNAWTCSRTPLADAMKADQLLVKYVRGNSLLPLVLDEWDLKHKPVLLMRHPFDVVTSQVKAFGARPADLDLESDYAEHVLLHEHWGRVKEISNPLERQLHLWCLLNVPLWQTYADSEEVVAVHYHDLVLDPEHSLKDILRQLAWNPQHPVQGWSPDAFVADLDLRATSDTDFGGDFLANQQDQLWKNIKRLTPEEKKRYQGVFDTYGLTLYSMDEVKPRRS